MSGFPIIDLVVGMIFIFFLLSIICSSAVELWLSMLSTRAKLLKQWLLHIFDSPALDSHGQPIPLLDSKGVQIIDKNGNPAFTKIGQSIMDHCMVTALSKPGKSTTYIDARNFVSALLDRITISPAAPGTNVVQLPPTKLADYIAAIQKSDLISGELKRTILSFANQAEQAAAVINTIPAAANITNNITTTIKSELDHFNERLEKWYDSNADRLTGTLKRKKVMPTTFILATIITISLNTDSIEISKYLYNNKEASKELAATAMNTYKNYEERITTMQKTDSIPRPADTAAINRLNKSTMQLKQDIDSIHALDIPIGWKGTNVKDLKTFWDYINFRHIVGWLATILAICMGAPFWFDLLNKIANLRGTGPKPSSSSNAGTKS